MGVILLAQEKKTRQYTKGCSTMYTLTITHTNGTQELIKTRSLDKAYAAYDKAIKNGVYVDSFTMKGSSSDLRDKPQSAIVYPVS
jgi:hypothetical protein